MQLFSNQINFQNQKNGESPQQQRKNITEVSFANKQDDLFNQASNFKLINNQTDVKQNNIHSIGLQQKDSIFNQNPLSFRKEFCNQKFQKDFLNIYNNDLELILDQFMICDQKNKSLKEVLAERYQPESYNKIIQLLLKKLDENSSLNSNTITNDQMFSQELIYDCQYNSPQSQTNVNYHTEDGIKEESIKKQNVQKMKNNNNIQEQKYRIHILETYWDDSFSVVITFQNISEKINNQELIKENQYKDQLLFTISHDLKTPLNGMQSILQAALLKDNVEQIKKMIQLVQVNGDLLNYLIKDILDYAQVIHKKIKPRPSYFNLQNTLQQIKQTFLYQIQEKGLKLNIVNNLSNSFLYTDEIRLKQIIFNFVSNALKFTFQGSITIKVEEVNDCGEIEDELNNDPDFTQSLNIQINNNQAFYNVNNINNLSSNKLNIQQLNYYNDFDSIVEKQTGFDEELLNQQNIQNLYSPNFPSNSNFLTNQKDSKLFQTPQLISNPIQARINSTPISQREFNKKHNVNLTKYCFTNNIEQFKKQINNEQLQNNQIANENQNAVIDIPNKKQNYHAIFDQSSIAQQHQSQLRKSTRLQKQITNQVTHSLRNSKNTQLSPSNTPDQPEKLLQQQNLQIEIDNESHKSLAIKTMNNYNIQQQDQENEIIQITVTDTGLGMDKDLQKQLFSMFGTFEQKGVNKEGVGLGLIITQSLSQLLGPKKDNIKVKSIKDQGSSFSFKIYRRLQQVDSPKRKANTILSSNKQQNLLGQNQKYGLNLKNNLELNIDDNDQEITTAINQNDTQKICDFIQNLLTRPYKMLIVDDVQFNISVFKCMLHQLQNVTFDHAYNGQQAIDKLKKNNYDIVFMDINMPVMDGIQATKQIRILIQQKLVQPTIIIALTGDDIDSDSNKFSSKGFNAALSKPIKLEDLYFVLKNLKLS
ncbi:response regulator receiver domain protein (macronuclear) [Tetrahymena thermophila SB210]|uniref:histidine kinase n=1 Tax=Tetrahymena thermophila (strain SB210) TaxID=312017 RepID=Q24HL5_TETTS|nr:response regulator receiver domain protein [Tetrahymena thermophila SB210]EAS07296.2 response regulator receiver domain protein [Tetrahymena thermophila SB210]|eukprot:XP_001027538.2 response regulator receiver domain protein [Tetrahymena thermophila SB210]